MTGLNKCPCGKTPKDFTIGMDQPASKWTLLSPDCCDYWMFEFKSNYSHVDSPEFIEAAKKAWNELPRGELEMSKTRNALVMRNPMKLGVGTLCRLMDDCLPEVIDSEADMQKLIDKLWPALVCEFEVSQESE